MCARECATVRSEARSLHCAAGSRRRLWLSERRAQIGEFARCDARSGCLLTAGLPARNAEYMLGVMQNYCVKYTNTQLYKYHNSIGVLVSHTWRRTIHPQSFRCTTIQLVRAVRICIIHTRRNARPLVCKRNTGEHARRHRPRQHTFVRI